MKRRFLSFLLAVLTAFTLAVPAMASGEAPDVPRPAAASSGKCGQTAWWSLSDDGTLTITGTGVVDPDVYAGWYDLADRAVKLVVKQGITGLLTSTFGGFSKLKSISLPNTLTNMGESTFSYCNGLTSVTIPGSYSVGWGDFVGCDSLKTVTIREGSRSIGSCAFSSCNALTTVSLPSTMERIDVSAFDSCTSLTSIVLPDGVTEVGLDAFRGCTKLRSVTVRNPRCRIAASAYTLGLPSTATIYGYDGSTAQAYAKKYGFDFRSLGKARVGWVDEGGQRYYWQDGKKLTGVWIIGGQRYGFDPKDGHMLKGQIVTGASGKQFYLSARDGHAMKGGLVTCGGKQYYAAASDGHLMKGGLVTAAGGKQYYVSAKDGHVMKGGWINGAGGRRYYAEDDGLITQIL